MELTRRINKVQQHFDGAGVEIQKQNLTLFTLLLFFDIMKLT